MQLVIDYIKKFQQFEEEIGVVSPNAQQCKAIKESCRQNGFEKINIGRRIPRTKKIYYDCR